jgi:hypothetical protein
MSIPSTLLFHFLFHLPLSPWYVRNESVVRTERSLADSQEAARRNLTAKAWAYMKSGATDERSESLPTYYHPTSNPPGLS